MLSLSYSCKIVDRHLRVIVAEMNEQPTESIIEENGPFAGNTSDIVFAQNQSNDDTAEGRTVEIFSEDVTNQLVESLLGSSSDANATKNYDSYNRMEGCSSDEENQTDNDDDNSVEKEEDTTLEHHYTELQNDIPDFGEFTAAPLNTLENGTIDISGTDVNLDHAASSPSAGFDDNLQETGIDSDKALASTNHHINAPMIHASRIGVESQSNDESHCYVSIPPLTAGALASPFLWGKTT